MIRLGLVLVAAFLAQDGPPQQEVHWGDWVYVIPCNEVFLVDPPVACEPRITGLGENQVLCQALADIYNKDHHVFGDYARARCMQMRPPAQTQEE